MIINKNVVQVQLVIFFFFGWRGIELPMGFIAQAMVKSLVSAKNQDHLSTENSQHGSGETVHCESDGSKIKKNR